MRFLLAIGLTILFLLPVFLFQWSSHWQRDQVRRAARHQIVHGLPRAQLHRFAKCHSQTTWPAEITWIEDHEFTYKGVFYDVVFREQGTDSLILYAWADLEETKLEREIDQLMARLLGQDPVHRHVRDRWCQFLKQLYPHAGQGTDDLVWLCKKNEVPCHTPCLTDLPESAPPSPPPRTVG